MSLSLTGQPLYLHPQVKIRYQSQKNFLGLRWRSFANKRDFE